MEIAPSVVRTGIENTPRAKLKPTTIVLHGLVYISTVLSASLVHRSWREL